LNYTQQDRDRTIALAALLQAVHLVHNIAVSGRADQAGINTLLNSLVVTDADTTEAVYGDLSQLKTGLDQLHIQLTNRKNKHQITQVQYAVNLMRLERKLAKFTAVMAVISREIDQIPEQIEYFGDIANEQVIARIAGIYQQTVSSLTPFIKVHGEANYLQNTHNANLVRALLLAGIRAAILWHQKGGRYWHFIFQSKKIEQITKELQASV
jgi:high frequency lysogenization protein